MNLTVKQSCDGRELPRKKSSRGVTGRRTDGGLELKVDRVAGVMEAEVPHDDIKTGLEELDPLLVWLFQEQGRGRLGRGEEEDG